MLIPIYIAFLLVGLVALFKFLAPEMNLGVRFPAIKFPDFKIPTIGRPKLMQDVSAVVQVSPLPLPEVGAPSLDIPLEDVYTNTRGTEYINDGVEKANILLAEKNKEIVQLKEELLVRQRQCEEFDKVKELLDNEILRLREQNRTLRSEASLQVPPTINQ